MGDFDGAKHGENQDDQISSPASQGYAVGTACIAAAYRFLLTPKQQRLGGPVESPKKSRGCCQGGQGM